MTAEVYISSENNKQSLQEHLTFKQCEYSKTIGIFTLKETACNIGKHLTGFLRIEKSSVESIFDKMIRTALSIKPHVKDTECATSEQMAAESINASVNELNKVVKTAVNMHPYLYFYANDFALVLIALITGQIYNANVLYERYPMLTNTNYKNNIEDEALLSFYPVKYLDGKSDEQKGLLMKSIRNLLFIKDAMLDDVCSKANVISSALSFIYDGADKTLNNRLYNYDVEHNFFNGYSFTMRLAQVGSLSILAEVYEINCITDLIRFDLIKVVSNSILIKKCVNCGHFFASYGRADTIYCDVSVPNQKLCSEVGPSKKFKQKTAKNPVFEAYNRAYKRNNAKFRAGKMDDFSTWSQEARSKRDMCIDGTLELAEFVEWLGNKK